jgi:hypothetical protein
MILDENGVYDPANFNDRLLLGLKGTMSEAELHVLKASLRGGILNKVRRGEYRRPLPTGFVCSRQRGTRSRRADPGHDRSLRRDVFACRLGMPYCEIVSEGEPWFSLQAQWQHQGVPAADHFDRYARFRQPPIRRRLRVRTSPVSASGRRPEKGPAEARLQ